MHYPFEGQFVIIEVGQVWEYISKPPLIFLTMPLQSGDKVIVNEVGRDSLYDSGLNNIQLLVCTGTCNGSRIDWWAKYFLVAFKRVA